MEGKGTGKRTLRRRHRPAADDSTMGLKFSNDAALLKTTGDKLIPILKKQPDHRIERLKNPR
jgi:hypothetical protein